MSGRSVRYPVGQQSFEVIRNVAWQIKRRCDGYRFTPGGRAVIKIGASFSSKTRKSDNWLTES